MPAPTLTDHWVLGLVGLGALLRTVYAVRYHVPHDIGDQIGYISAGHHFVDWWRSPDALRTPGYPLFVALADGVGLGLNGLRVLQGIAVSAAALLAAVVAGRNFGLPAGRAAAGLGALLPPLITISAPVLSDALASALFAAAVLCICEGWRRPDRRALLGAAGILLAAAMLVRPNLGVLVPILVFAVWVTGRSGRERARGVGVLAVCFLVLFGPWMGRNYAVLGKPYPLGTNRIAFLLGVALPVDRATGRFGAFERDRDYFVAKQIPGGVRTYAEVSPLDPGEVLRENLAERPKQQASASLFWIRELWLWPSDDHLVYGRESIFPWPLLLAAHLGFLLTALVGLWTVRRSPAIRIIAASTLALTAPFAVFQSSPRYAIPAVLILLVPAGVGLTEMSARLRRAAGGRGRG